MAAIIAQIQSTLGSFIHQILIRYCRSQTFEFYNIFKGSLSYLQDVQTGSGATPASCAMGNVSCFLAFKAAGVWSWPFISF
jgi:hypothetical protein